MDLHLEGRTAIVCGASSGIGHGIAEVLAEEGANVVMFARRQELLEREAKRLGALAVTGDVTVADDVERLARSTIEAFGGVDILVNNSGGPPRSACIALDPQSVRAAVELLLVSAIRLPPHGRPHRQSSGRGRIVNVSSSAVREPIDSLALSNAVRPGVVGWAKTLAREVGPLGITVNSIAPGWIDTDRIRETSPDGVTADELATIPARRLGSPREIGYLVAFLCSDRASYINGTVIPFDGGLTRSLL